MIIVIPIILLLAIGFVAYWALRINSEKHGEIQINQAREVSELLKSVQRPKFFVSNLQQKGRQPTPGKTQIPEEIILQKTAQQDLASAEILPQKPHAEEETPAADASLLNGTETEPTLQPEIPESAPFTITGDVIPDSTSEDAVQVETDMKGSSEETPETSPQIPEAQPEISESAPVRTTGDVVSDSTAEDAVQAETGMKGLSEETPEASSQAPEEPLVKPKRKYTRKPKA